MCARVSSTTRSSVRAIVAGHGHLDEREIARHGRHGAEVLDLQHVDQLVEIGGDALGARLVAVDHDRHARDAGLGRAADGERLDVEGAAAEDERDAVEHAGFVFDERDECVMHI